MTYEYDFEDIGLDKGQRHLVEMNMADVDVVNPLIKDVINKRAKAGWEPLYPFAVPLLWFRRVAQVAKKTKKN